MERSVWFLVLASFSCHDALGVHPCYSVSVYSILVCCSVTHFKCSPFPVCQLMDIWVVPTFGAYEQCLYERIYNFLSGHMVLLESG